MVEPTLTPRPGDEEISVALLPLGEPGQYVNVSFGYWLQYPVGWYTRFGNRPLLVSFSNLDPGTHNRLSMREQGCLIEVNASANIYGFTFETLGVLELSLSAAASLGWDASMRTMASSKAPCRRAVSMAR